MTPDGTNVRPPDPHRTFTNTTAGLATGPPAPPRDGLEEIGDLMECFDFS